MPSVSPSRALCANSNSALRLYTCEAYELALSSEGYSEYSGSLTFWLVDADGACVDDGESSIECSIRCDLEAGAVQSLDVYAPDGKPIELHADCRGALESAAQRWWDAQTDDDAAEAHYEALRGWL